MTAIDGWVRWVLWLLMLTHPPAVPTHTSTVTHTYSTGRATFYTPGLMEKVATKRGVLLGGASGFATYPDCSTIGDELMVSVQDPHTGKWSAWSDKRIVDCSQPQDYQRHVAEGLVELSYSDAVRYGYATEGHTSIRFYLPSNRR